MADTALSSAASSVSDVGTPPSQKSQKQREVPPFLRKLYHMVDDPSTNNSIRWLESGDGFLLVNAEVFAKDVLPLYFKHNNFATFVRQLNMYDFSKVGHVEKGVVHIGEFHSWQFTHPYFRRGHPELLSHIHRKKAKGLSDTYQPQPDKRIKSEHSLDELARQFEELRTENQDMRETINLLKEESQELRNQNQIFLQNSQMAMTKAHELQVTIERIIQFLASVYSPEFIRQQLQQQPNMLNNISNNAMFNNSYSQALSIAPGAADVNHNNLASNNSQGDFRLISGPGINSGHNNQLISAYSNPTVDYLKSLMDSGNADFSQLGSLAPIPMTHAPLTGQGNLVGQVGDESSHPADMGDWNFDNLLPLGPAINISSPLTDETGSEAEGVGGAPSDDVMHFLQHDMEDDNPRQPKKERVD